MQVTNTVTAWTNQLNVALGQKIEELIQAQVPSFEADVEMRGFFDQLYIDLVKFEKDASVRMEVIYQIQKLDNQICKITLH